MSDDVRRRLEAAHALFKDIESSSSDVVTDEESLAKLMALLGTLESERAPHISKLASLVAHLKPGMSLRTFVNLLVPLERALNKNIQDDDFLVTDVDSTEPAGERLPLRFVLDNIRSAFNVGSILRTADGLGVERVHLCGYTPTPDEDKTARTALGAQHAVEWEASGKISELLSEMKNSGWRLVALETSSKALELAEPFEQVPTVFVFGNERFGLGSEVLSLCDEVRRLPLRGTKNSLNVGVAAAIAAYEWSRQWNR